MQNNYFNLSLCYLINNLFWFCYFRCSFISQFVTYSVFHLWTVLAYSIGYHSRCMMCCWIYLNCGFFHILCYYYKLRIGSVKKRIAIILEESDPKIQQSKVQILLKRLNQIIESVVTDNKVWNKVNFIFYFFHLNVGTMINILIFFKTSFVVTSLYAYLIFTNFTTVSLIAISSAQVNYEFKKISKELYGLLICKGITTELKLKVTIIVTLNQLLIVD